MSARRGSRWIAWIEHARPEAVLAAVVGSSLVVALGDWLSGPDIGFTVAYLFPIAIAAWRSGRGGAVVAVLLCGLTSLFVRLLERSLELPPVIEALNMAMRFLVFFAFALVLCELRFRLREAQRLARTDSLTGCINRRAFRGRLAEQVARSQRFGEPFTLAYLDVDDFKAVNDRLGHQTGDELLQAVADTLHQGVRETDLVGRLGGDEFALLLPGTDAMGAAVVMARLRAVIEQGLRRTFGVGCSIGCLSVLRDAPSVDELIARADALMYEVKQQGGGRMRHETLPEATVPVLRPRRKVD